MISENTVYKYMDDKGDRIRIIYIDESNNEFAYVNIDVNFCMPIWEKLSKIKEEIGSNVLVKIVDPYLEYTDESKLTQLERDIRDFNWSLIKEVHEKRSLEILNLKIRSKIIREISTMSGTPAITLKRIFSRFWKRGMRVNGLIPDYKNSGGKGRIKNSSDNKVGRPRLPDNNGQVITGINITEDIKKQFEIALNKYYRNRKQISLMQTYRFILRDFFTDQFIENGERKFIVWDKSRIPKYDQFYYWFKNSEDVKKDFKLREGSKAFELNERPILSNSTVETDGPGSRVQVDATVADIYLVSSFDRNKIIGRPVVYAIIDVFSRLVTGIYAGLEGPSWIGAMMALDNMVADKVEFCKSHDINITEDQWPAKHLPDIIIADRGEFEGYSVENLINNLNVKIENTSPYRGDLKGIVERNFRTLNTKLKHMTPGAIQKEFRRRGDPDYRLDATLTLEEFTRIYINLVLQHNNKIVDKYPVHKEMLADSVVPIPSQLWNWGIENKKGRLRIVDRDVLRLNLLPKAKASISRAGICFKGLYYGSQKALEEQWFIKSKVRSMEILYDPRNMNNIYIPSESGEDFETCYLLKQSMQYKDCILEEIIYNSELISELVEMQKNLQNQVYIDTDAEIDKIVREAKKKKSKEIDYGVSNNKRLKGIKNNRKVEKEINRAYEAFEIGKDEIISRKADDVIEISGFKKDDDKKGNEEDNEGKKTIMKMLKKKRDERRER